MVQLHLGNSPTRIDQARLARAHAAFAVEGTTGPEPNMLDEALALATLGFSVFPCEMRGKRPVGRLVPNGFLNATRDPDVIRRWWSLGQWNIGLATGNGLVVLDIDPRNGGVESLRRLPALPRTWMVNTGGGGGHAYLAVPPGVTIGNLGAGIDVQGDGKYVIAPPSVHPSGRRYTWHCDHDPASIPITLVPDSLVDLSQWGSGEKGATRASDFWPNFIRRKFPEGERNNALAQRAGYLFWCAVDRDVVLELVWSFNATHCAPPLSADEVKATVVSIWMREQRRREGFR